MNASFFGAAIAAPKPFPASAAQQGKPIYERFLSDLCPKKRKSFYFSALEKNRSMVNEPNITYVLSISWLPLAEPWRITTTIAAGGLSGGVTSSMAGGDFWDGLCNGLISSGLNHAMHLVAEGFLPDDPPGKDAPLEKRENYIRLEGKKYFWQLKHHYLEGNGEDVFLTKDQFADIISHGKIDYDNAVLGEDGFYEAGINLYDTNKDLHYSFGRATVKYQIDNDGKIHYSGFHDEYNFDSKPWGIRSTSAEIITRTYNAITNGTNFQIYYNKTYFAK